MQQSNMLLNDNEHKFVGIHVLAEVYGVDQDKLDDLKLLLNSMEKGIELSGATLCDIKYKKFEPQGCTIVAVLSESHVSFHSYPEMGCAFIDAFTCGFNCNPIKIIEQLSSDLQPTQVESRELRRGKIDIEV